MASAAELQVQLDRLKEIRARGTRSIQDEGERVEYFGPGELNSTIDRLERELRAAGGGPGVRRRLRITVAKGL